MQKKTALETLLEYAITAGHVTKIPNNLPSDIGLDALTFCTTLFPQRVCQYDTEVITEPMDYLSILNSHCEVTDREWTISKFNATGNFEKQIELTFVSNNKTASWKLLQNNSDWIVEDFFKKLHLYTSRNLLGTFVQLETNDQSAAFVYLPKNEAKILKKVITNASQKHWNINSIVARYRKGSHMPSMSPDDQEDLMGLFNLQDRLGDTPLTASIKSDNDQGVLDIFTGFKPDPTAQDSDGNSPWHLALAGKNKTILHWMAKYASDFAPKGIEPESFIIKSTSKIFS